MNGSVQNTTMDCESQFIITFATVKHRFTIGFILLFFCSLGYALPPEGQTPEKGILDLRNADLDEQSFFSLNGEWEFYWKKLLCPDTYTKEKGKNEGIPVRVPSYWDDYNIEGQQLTGVGYGTYALTVILPENYNSALCLDIPVFDVAYKFFLNDSLVRKNGTVGTSKETEKPWYEPGTFCYIPDRDTLQLLIQVSNYNHRRGGFWKPVFLGGSSAILSRTENRAMFNYSTMGTLLFIIVFFSIFWLATREDTVTILFAITALGILIRSVNTGLYFSNSVVDTPWAWQIRMEYFGTYLAYLFGMFFLHRMFYRKYMENILKANAIISIRLIISVFTMPPGLFAYSMLVFQPLVLLFLAHYIVLSFIGTVRGKLMDAIFFVALGLFIYTLVNDIMLANSGKAMSTTYLTQLSFQFFILAMSVLIIMQWVNNYKIRHHLESSLRFKTKVLSVIAHDLKTPVASVAQFVDLLNTKPELADKKEILNSLHESSQAAVTLLDNLLYWGRSQSDELKASPVELDLGLLVSEVKSLYAHMALQKKVEFTSSIPPNTLIYADKDLLNIIIRNLISNALKFTPAQGSVSIHARTIGDMVEATVTDTGIGIKAEILEQFRNEGQLASSMGTDKEIGTGLGLQLVSDLLAKSNGTLRVESSPEKGSIFTFTLPVRKT